jgi:hypothetical protein
MHEKTKKHISNKVGHPPIENIPTEEDSTNQDPTEEDIFDLKTSWHFNKTKMATKIIINKMTTTKICTRCAIKLKNDRFYYNGKDHTYCFSCAEKRTTVKNKCQTCGIRAIYNIPGETFGISCKKHSTPNMVDVKNPKCITCRKKQSTFNKPGETKGLYCADCAEPNMVDVKHPKCITCRKKIPHFNKPGETKGLYCADCAEPNMVDVKNPKCITCRKKIPHFNKPGETKGLYCADCAEPNMVDVKHPKCQHELCKTRASYGIPCNAPVRCAQHKEAGMIIRPRGKCRSKNCNNVAEYGVNTPIHCFTHKTSNDIILVEQTCQECGRIDVLFNGKCVNFCCAGEIDKEYKKNQKLKEKRILGILTAEYKEPTEYNIRLDRDCGGNNREEKEIGYDFSTHKLFIEVDENQHKSYCEQGEIGRMKNIYHAEGGIPVIFIRYNPDNFKVGGKRQNLSQAKREELLIKWCKYYEDKIPESPLVVNYLFYDDWVPGKCEEYDIDPYNHECYKCNCGEEFWVKSMYDKHIEYCGNN